MKREKEKRELWGERNVVNNWGDYYEEHKDEINKKKREDERKLRLEVLIHYGGSPPKCACCGESIIEFLTIDHIESPKIKRTSSTRKHLCRWLKKNGFPEGFQVLCWNCDCAKGHYGVCPHEK